MPRPATSVPDLFVPSSGLVVARDATTVGPQIVLVYEVLIEGVWQDFSCYVRGATLQRGTTSPTGPFEASVLSLTLDNPDGLLSPWVQITPWSSELARVFRANIGVRLSITSTSDAAEDLFASNPAIGRGPVAPVPADGKVGDLWLTEGASTTLWGPKGPADALPPPQFLGEHFWSTDPGSGLIWLDGTTLVWSRYDRNGVDRLQDFLDYARPGSDLTVVATPPAGRGYLDATLGTVTTADPGPLPDEFTIVTRLTGPTVAGAATSHAVVGQWESTAQQSWKLERSEADGHFIFDTFDGPSGPVPPLFSEPFDDLNAWTVTGTPTIVAGRTGTAMSAVGTTTGTNRSFTSDEWITIGMAWRTNTTNVAARTVFELWGRSNAQRCLYLQYNGTTAQSFTLYRETTGQVLGTSATGLLAVNTWGYIEVRARLHDTLGQVEVRLNGTTIISATGIDTRPTANETGYDALYLRSSVSGLTCLWDDLYYDTGATSTFRGDYPIPPADSGDTTGTVLTEPFDNLTNWALTGAPTIVAGRTGTGAQFTSPSIHANYTIPAPSESDTVVVGFALRQTVNTSTTDFLWLRSDAAATDHVRLRLNNDGSFMLNRAGVAMTSNSAAGLVPLNTWVYVEVRAKLHDTAGFATVRVNGTQVLNFVGDTRNAGTKTTFDTVRITGAGASATTVYDDLYVKTGASAQFAGDPTTGGSGGGGGGVLTSRPTEVASLPLTPTAETLAVAIKLADAGTTHATLWRSYDDGATWATVGSGDLTVPTDTVFDATTVMRIGALGAGVDTFDGRIHTVELRTGLDPTAGTLLWRFDADEYPGTGTSYADPRGRSWTLSGAGIITRHRAQTFSDTVATLSHSTDTITVAFDFGFPLSTFAVPGSVVRTDAQPETPVDTDWNGTTWPWSFAAPSLPIPRIEFARAFPAGPSTDWPERSVIVVPPVLPNVAGDPGARYDVYQLLADGTWDWLGYYVADPAPLAVWNEDLAAQRWQLFVGMVDSWVDHDLADGDRFVEVTASDGFKFLANHEFTQLATPVGSGETGGARITRILDATRRQPFTDAVVPSQGWRWGFRVDPGDVQMAGWDRGRPALEEIQQTVLAEGGRVFVDRLGALVFFDNARLTATDRDIDWTVGDGRDTGSICATAVVTSCDDLDVVNQVGVGRAEPAPAPGAPAEPSTDVWRRDEESITLHGQRTGRFLDLPHLLDADSGRIADRILSATAALDYHVSRLEVTPLSELQGWEFVVNVELMDLVRVTRIHSLQRLDDVARVVGIAHTMTPGTYAVVLTLGPPVRIIANTGWDLSLWDNPPDDLWSDS